MNQRIDSLSRTYVIRGASIVTLDDEIGDIVVGDIRVQDGKIVEIAPRTETVDVPVIDAGGMIAIPGFVDSHRHCWEGLLRNALPNGTLTDYFETVNGRLGPAYTPSDVYAGTLVSALGALNAGVTTVLDRAHIQNTPADTDASVQALRDAGIRAVFGFGTPTAVDQGNRYPEDILRLAATEFASKDQLLILALATNSPEHSPDELAKHCWRTAREAGARITAHAGMWGFGAPNEIERFAREGMLGPDVTLVHCGFLSDTEWKLVADTGTTVSLSAQIELLMGHGSAPAQQALDVGLVPSLSVDVETSVPGDFFTHMRATLAEQRGEVFRRVHRGETDVPDLIGVRDVLTMATVAGAEANGLSDKVGSLTVGKQADIVLLRADSLNVFPVDDLAGAVVSSMDVSNVDTVIVAGRIVKHAGQMVGLDLEGLRDMVYDARDRVFARADLPHADRRRGP